MEQLSVSKYVEILTLLMDSVEKAINGAEQSHEINATTSIEEYRSLVMRQLILVTDDFLTSLPNAAESGAAVTLRDYGYRNRDDVIRRIQIGMHDRVEESFQKRQSLK